MADSGSGTPERGARARTAERQTVVEQVRGSLSKAFGVDLPGGAGVPALQRAIAGYAPWQLVGQFTDNRFWAGLEESIKYLHAFFFVPSASSRRHWMEAEQLLAVLLLIRGLIVLRAGRAQVGPADCGHGRPRHVGPCFCMTISQSSFGLGVSSSGRWKRRAASGAQRRRWCMRTSQQTLPTSVRRWPRARQEEQVLRQDCSNTFSPQSGPGARMRLGSGIGASAEFLS